MLDTHGYFNYQNRVLLPLLELPFFEKVHPHFITVLGCLIGITVCPLLAFHYSAFAAVALILSGFFDTLDGALARYWNIASPQGAALDIFCDRIVEFAVLFGLYAFSPNDRSASTLFMLGSVLLCITSFLVVAIFSKNDSYKSFFYSPGLIERTEAFGFFLTMIIWPSSFFLLSWLFSLLVLLTALLRLWQFFNYQQFEPIKISTDKNDFEP